MPQTYYDLPHQLKDIDTLVTNTVGTLHCYLTPQEWQRLEVNTEGSGEPYYYTIMQSDIYRDRWQVRFVGVPTNGTVVHYTYRRTPVPIKYMGYERIARQGTVSSSGFTVTGSDTAFPMDADDSIIRFGADGMPADGLGSTFPWVRQRTIESVQSANSLTLAPTIETAAGLVMPANTQYAITDKIDASPTMFTAILSACEMWYARVAGKPADVAMQMFSRDLRIAMENDAVAPRSGRPHHTPYPTPRSMGWHSEPTPDLP
jgi:hypothetical protein